MTTLAALLSFAGYQAAKRLLRKLLKRQMRPPRVMITDNLASYGAEEGGDGFSRAPAA